jgi:hypothetical protein
MRIATESVSLWHAKERLTAFLELESAIFACGEFVLANEIRFREIVAPKED